MMNVKNAFRTGITHHSSLFLKFLSLPYGLVAQCRNAFYDQGWLAQRRLPCRVVSIGNLTVGGTGKTPVTIFVTNALLSAGRRTAVLSRGYRRKSRSRHVLVSDGAKILVGPDEAGDEPYLIAQRCPGAVVAVGADRYRLGRWVLEQCPVDCAVLDDGFQHRALARDVDLVLVDATDIHGLQALVPAGRLREPLVSAKRASAILVTRVDAISEARPVTSMIQQETRRAVHAILVQFVSGGFVDVRDGERASADDIAGQAAVIFSGIGNAGAFRALVLHQGLSVADEMIFPDHHAYTTSDIAHLQERATRAGASILVTTEKDAVKLHGRLPPGMPVWAMRLETQILDGKERLMKLITMSDER